MRKIRIGVYSPQGELIGYKLDTGWTLGSKEEAKQHETSEDGRIGPHLLRNLSTVLTEIDAEHRRVFGDRFFVVAEDLETSKELRRYEFNEEDSGYKVTEPAPERVP